MENEWKWPEFGPKQLRPARVAPSQCWFFLSLAGKEPKENRRQRMPNHIRHYLVHSRWWGLGFFHIFHRICANFGLNLRPRLATQARNEIYSKLYGWITFIQPLISLKKMILRETPLLKQFLGWCHMRSLHFTQKNLESEADEPMPGARSSAAFGVNHCSRQILTVNWVNWQTNSPHGELTQDNYSYMWFK